MGLFWVNIQVSFFVKKPSLLPKKLIRFLFVYAYLTNKPTHSYTFMAFLKFIVALLFFFNPSSDSEITDKLTIYSNALEKSESFTGVVLVRFGDTYFERAMGFSNVESGEMNTTDTWFRYASISKPFTAVLLYRLEQDGLLNIENTLSDFYDDYPNGDKITLAHLLAHKSGIPNYTSFDDFTETMHLPTTNSEIIDRFKYLDLEFEPGTKFAYSNSGYALLSDIIERVTGLTYAEALKQYVLEPAGIDQAAYEDPELNFPLLARGYLNPIQNEVALKIHMSIPQGAGGVAGNALSLIQLVDAVYDDGFITEASRNHMFKPVSGNYGHGWALGPLLDIAAVGHAGGINGFSTNFIHIPTKELTIVVLSNAQSSNVGMITRDLAAIVLGRSYTLPERKVRVHVSAETLRKYEGVYELVPGFSITVTTEENRIFAQATNQPQFEIFPSSETEFFLTVVDAQITFNLDDDQNVIGLTLFQGGQTMPARKLD
jgi:CubicO group peptidase (beta-lactamase class C family)